MKHLYITWIDDMGGIQAQVDDDAVVIAPDGDVLFSVDGKDYTVKAVDVCLIECK